jgi:hypothetical protein
MTKFNFSIFLLELLFFVEQFLMWNYKKSLKIPKGESESVNQRTDNTMVKRKSTKTNLQNITHKTQDRVTHSIHVLQASKYIVHILKVSFFFGTVKWFKWTCGVIKTRKTVEKIFICRTDSRTLVYHNTSRLKDGRIKT